MNRAAFLTIAGGAPFARFAGQDVIDPAMQAPRQSLRVLLGRGQATAIDQTTLIFNGRRYRGTFSTDPLTGEIVNELPLEQYLYSVVPREMPRDWPPAALQAQAIAARTYVLERSSPQRGYDLTPSQASQVYTGIDAEHPQTSAAVDATAGMVLRYGTAYAQTVYSSCCGGHTESSHDAWNGPPVPYLGGVTCTYCSASPWYRWTRALTDAQLGALAVFAQLGVDASQLVRIDLDGIDASGRAAAWTFVAPDASAAMRAEAIRAALGGQTLPSLRVARIDMPQPQAAGSISIEGAGLGHGVGLCQWGARGLALAGNDAAAILAYYYPGTQTAHGL